MLGSKDNNVMNFGIYGGSDAGKNPATCIYVAQLKGKGFVPLANASPLCGEVIPGIKTGY
jgi:hypothetical protein